MIISFLKTFVLLILPSLVIAGQCFSTTDFFYQEGQWSLNPRFGAANDWKIVYQDKNASSITHTKITVNMTGTTYGFSGICAPTVTCSYSRNGKAIIRATEKLGAGCFKLNKFFVKQSMQPSSTRKYECTHSRETCQWPDKFETIYDHKK